MLAACVFVVQPWVLPILMALPNPLLNCWLAVVLSFQTPLLVMEPPLPERRLAANQLTVPLLTMRSEERRVGKECGLRCTAQAPIEALLRVSVLPVSESWS